MADITEINAVINAGTTIQAAIGTNTPINIDFKTSTGYTGNQTFKTQDVLGTEVTNTITLDYVAVDGSIVLSINALMYTPGTDYSINAARNILTLTDAIETDDAGFVTYAIQA